MRLFKKYSAADTTSFLRSGKKAIPTDQKVPFSFLKELLTDFIKSLSISVKRRKFAVFCSCLIGTIIFVWTIKQGPIKDLNAPGAALITLAGAFYVTAGLALVMGVLDKSDQKRYAENILDAINNHQQELGDHFAIFVSKFYNTLEKIFK